METTVTFHDIIADDLTPQQLLLRLRERILTIHNGKTALERGGEIKRLFPSLAEDTITLADQAMKGMLVLPGTGPDLYFVGSPARWLYNPVNNNEYTFHLNRMHHLKTLAEAYSLTGDPEYAKKALAELEDWIDHVPCPSIFQEDGTYATSNFEGLSPWRALEVGIRGYRTWPIIIELLADTPYFSAKLLEKLVVSIYTHCQILYHISPLLWPRADHNHYLMENLGLMSFCLLFPEMKDSGEYFNHSQRELDRCMKAQCTPCGGQVEGCPSYHNGCVFWFAMRIVFARKFHVDVPQEYCAKLEQMFVHSVAATRPCGGNFPWGDSHIWKETMSLAAVSCYMAYSDPKYLAIARHFYPETTIMEDVRDNLWRIADLENLKKSLSQDTLDKVDLNEMFRNFPLTAWQKDLDQVYARTGWEKDAMGLMTGCRTPVKNLHAHIDAGGFDFLAYGETLVTDPSIYTYKNDENRKHFKSAFWHNCLTVNWKNMWEYRGSWSYGPQKDGHILSVTEQEGLLTVISRHNNYEPAVASRCLSLIDGRFLLVADRVSGLSKDDSVQIHFHLDRTFVQRTPYGLMTVSEGHPNLEFLWDAPLNLQMEIGKISTAGDVWHDSLLVHLEHVAKQEETFYHAAVLLPHKAGDTKPSCCSYETKVTDQGLCVKLNLDGHFYEFQWDGDTQVHVNRESPLADA